MDEQTRNAGALGSTDRLGQVPERWYVLTTEGLATLCATEADARTVKAHADVAFPRHGPHRVALLGDVAAERERLCAAIKAADDKASEGDYMLDSDDCISVIRGTWTPGA